MTRTEMLRDKIIGVTPQLCPERARFYTQAWRENEGLPTPVRRAHAFKAILEHQSVFISPGELIVGNQAGRPIAAPVFPEYGMAWMEKELDTLSERRLDPFLVDEDTKKELIEIGRYWDGKTHYDHVKSETLRVLPAEYLKGWDPDNGVLNDTVSNSGRMSTGDGHVIVNFEPNLSLPLPCPMRALHSGLQKLWRPPV